jgi:uncharacterized membrane protein
MNSERLVKDYLDRLDAAARPLAAGRRHELMDEVQEHIEADLARAGQGDEATVHEILDRLGPPEAIVAAELGSGPSGASEASLILSAWQRGLGISELLAILLLTFGAVVAPVIGPAIGLVLTWVSTRWSRRTKLVITAVALVLLVLPVVLLMAVGSHGPGG